MDEPMVSTEHTLATLQLAHVYKLPPRPSASGGWHCQEWPKENHIFSGRVVITAEGEKCTIKLVDKDNGTLFAQCPLDNNNPALSVEPAVDSSRYFVLRVSDGSGRYAYLGMGFVERSDAFEFNVTLADHVKRLRNEKEAAALAAAPAPPPQDFSLKGSISIGIPSRGGGGGEGAAAPKPRAVAPPSGGAGGLFALQPPPPAAGQPSRGRRPVASAPPDPFGAAPFAASPAGSADPFANDAFAMPSSSDPFAMPSSAQDPFSAASSSAAPSENPFGDASPFGADAAFGGTPFAPPPASGASSGQSADGASNGWVAFG